MKLIPLFFLLVITFGCVNKDCSSIDLKTLNDIRLPPKIDTRAATLTDLNGELDHYLHKTHRLILRCKSEDDFEQDRVLPGVMLWISDKWDLRNDTSKLGRIFAKHQIDPWERTRVAGILYHRHLNEQEGKADLLLEDARVRSAWRGRVRSVSMLEGLNAVQQKKLTSLIQSSDSIVKILNNREIGLSPVERSKSGLDKIIRHRYETMELLGRLGRTPPGAGTLSADPVVKKDSLLQKMFADFDALAPAEKLIRLEEIRVRVLNDEVSTLPPTKPEVPRKPS